MTAAKTKQVKVSFVKEKETKNKVRYHEESKEPVIEKLYVSKTVVKALGDPEKLTVTLDPA